MNRYWVDQPTKTTPTSADIVCIRDVADSDKTKKSILSNLWAAIWGTNDSDNINEWATNLFYTTARNLLKANESEVIHNTWDETWITWTKSWTYVLSTSWNITTTWDISCANISWDWTNLTNVPVSITGQTEEPAITDWDELAFYDTTAGANRKIDYTDLSFAIRGDIWNSYRKALLTTQDNSRLSIMWEDLSNWHDVIAGGFVNRTDLSIVIWGTNSWDDARTYFDLTNWLPTTVSTREFIFRASHSAWTSTSWSGFVGVTQSSTFASNITPTITQQHAWFVFTDDGVTQKVYATNANWTTQTLTEITGITVSNKNTYYLKATSSNIEYYVNGTLKATHTTNLAPNAHIIMLEANVDTWTNGSSLNLVWIIETLIS